MSKLWAVFVNDLRLSIKGLYFYIEIILALAFILVMLIAVPNNFNTNREYYVFYDLKSNIGALSELVDNENVVLVDSRLELEEALKENRSAIGLEFKEVNNETIFEIVLQGHESESLRNFIKAEIEGYLISETDNYQDYSQVTILQQNPDSLSDRENILPVYLTLNVALMGLFIVSAYIFLDKEEGLVKAFAVSPLEIWQYLASKAMIILVTGVLTSMIVVFSIMQFRINYLNLLLAVVSFNLFGSALGILISSFYDSMVKAMEALYGVIMIMIIGSITYFVPAFNPVWIKALPVYPMLFSFREILLEYGDMKYVLQNALIFFVLGGLIFAYATRRFSKSLSV